MYPKTTPKNRPAPGSIKLERMGPNARALKGHATREDKRICSPVKRQRAVNDTDVKHLAESKP